MRVLQGNFGHLSMEELCALLSHRGARGDLVCEAGAVRKIVTLFAGTAVHAVSNDPREYLGRILVQLEAVTEEQLARGLEAQRRDGVMLGQALVAAGATSDETVREALAVKLRETLLDVFTWRAGTFRFEIASPAESACSVALGELVRTARERAAAWETFLAELPARDGGFEVTAVLDAPPASLDARFVALARAGKTVGDIELAVPAPRFRTLERLHALVRRGVLRPLQPASTPLAAPPRAAADV